MANHSPPITSKLRNHTITPIVKNFILSLAPSLIHRIDDLGMCILFVIFTHKFNFMRTNIELDDVLVNQAIKLSKLRTKREVIQEALKSYVASMKKRQLLNLKGRVSWEGNLKDMRSL
jgi:Arc/MetJ family transcription regulator